MNDDAQVPGGTLERYRAYLQMLARLQLVPRLRNQFDSSDVVQQTLLKAHEKQQQFRGQGEAEFKAWLRRILANELTNWFRKYVQDKPAAHSLEKSLEQSSAHLEEFLAANQSSPSERALRHELVERLAEALAQLPEDQRRAVEMKHLQGCPIADIAQQMGRTVDAVAGLLRRGLANLQKHLQDYRGNPS